MFSSLQILGGEALEIILYTNTLGDSDVWPVSTVTASDKEGGVEMEDSGEEFVKHH